MKITLDKDMTKVSEVAKTRKAMKEFKAAYTDGDLKNALLDALRDIDQNGTLGLRNDIWGSETLRCDVKAFPGSYADTLYNVEMVFEKWKLFVKASFYCYQDMTVEKRYGTVKAETYRLPETATI